jgi:2-amino-4-hydroxy-6-hydroxymethyldihydropteridine diphosphokinase
MALGSAAALRAPRVNRPLHHRVAIGLGASLGDRRATLERTLVRLDLTPGMRLIRASRWYRTPPLRGGAATGWFLNGVAVFACSLAPHVVLERCRELERAEGRRRSRHWGDRTLDLDVILVEGVALRDPVLTVPHPALAERPFVLGPLLEVWPDAIDAATGRAIAEHPRATRVIPVPVGVVARPRPAVTPAGHRVDPWRAP